jgi:uncharacterized protein YbaR (Trm112 family)
MEEKMEKLKLFPQTKSICHNAPMLIVRSRKGGLVTKNCINCGEPNKIVFDELPNTLPCPTCLQPMDLFIDRYKSYAYACKKCKKDYLLGDLIPHWDEYFDEHGFTLPSDYDQNGNIKY